MNGLTPSTAIAAAATLVALALAAIATAAIAVRRARRQRRDSEEKLTHAVQRAERAARARDTFFDLTTHELRSPLAAVLGYQELLAEGAYGTLPDGAQEAIERIGRSALHLVHLIDGVVELSRLRTGTVEPDIEPVHLGPILSEAAESIRIHARDRRIPLESHLPDDPGYIATDPERLAHALDLLITSAVKHPGDHGLTFHVRRNADTLEISILGAAIEPRDDEDDPVLRLGLRLAVTAGLAQLLGGRLDVSEADGRFRNLHLTIRSLRDEGFDGPAASG